MVVPIQGVVDWVFLILTVSFLASEVWVVCLIWFIYEFAAIKSLWISCIVTVLRFCSAIWAVGGTLKRSIPGTVNRSMRIWNFENLKKCGWWYYCTCWRPDSSYKWLWWVARISFRMPIGQLAESVISYSWCNGCHEWWNDTIRMQQYCL